MSKESVMEFFDNMSDEESKELKQTSKSASVEGGNNGEYSNVDIPGNYVMQAKSFAFIDKTTKEVVCFPRVENTAKGAIQLIVNLEVVDAGTEVVKPGATIYAYITLAPKPGGDAKKLANIMKYMKPQLAALSGQEDFSINKDWVLDVCNAEYEEKDGKVVLVKDHKLKSKVYVSIENSEWNNKISRKVSGIRPFKSGDVSVSDDVAAQPSTNFAGTTSAPSGSSDDFLAPTPTTNTIEDDF